VQPIFAKVESHAAALGRFERVNTHEPKNAPGRGLTCAIWVDHLEPILSSGLDSSSAVLRINVRVFQNMVSEPQDAIDPNVVDAVSELFGAYAGDFEFDGLVRQVDLHGTTGVGLQAQAGYINQDGTLFRCMTITLPLIINDAWEQTP
jgi:hypothetical protein